MAHPVTRLWKLPPEYDKYKISDTDAICVILSLFVHRRDYGSFLSDSHWQLVACYPSYGLLKMCCPNGF